MQPLPLTRSAVVNSHRAHLRVNATDSVPVRTVLGSSVPLRADGPGTAGRVAVATGESPHPRADLGREPARPGRQEPLAGVVVWHKPGARCALPSPLQTQA